MKPLRIPAFLHDVFGERQSLGAVVTVLLFGASLAIVLHLVFPEMGSEVSLWRSVLAFLLIFDIFAGVVANFTSGTNNYYASRAAKRIVFLSIHVHIVLVALLLQTGLLFSLMVWAYTVGGAFVVNALNGRASQLFVAGALLAAGLGMFPMLPFDEPYMLIVGNLFLLKVLFSFTIDHYGHNRRVAEEGTQERI